MKALISAIVFLVFAIWAHEPRADTFYVNANVLNCRAEPFAHSVVVSRLQRGVSVVTDERNGDWTRVTSPHVCWVSSRYLSADYVASSGTTTVRGLTSNNRSSATRSRSRPSQTPRQTPRYDAGGCPCSGSRVCIGPRGGRYCITSGGNKRYGV